MSTMLNPRADHVPSVHVVLVSHNPGLWFEEVLESIAAQDLLPSAVTVVDAGSESDPTERVQRVLPQADVCLLEQNMGFGPAINEAVLGNAPSSDFYVFCHDDVALAPNALRLLASEAVAAEVGMVGPKYVEWDEPSRIRNLGLLVDRTGAVVFSVEPGEYDQQQHDQIQDTFAVPGGCVLVRSDLFHAAEGFDSAMSLCYEHIDLCWRLRTMGARVMVAPEVVVRHRQGLRERLSAQQIDRLHQRHQLRTICSVYRLWYLVVLIPQVVLLGLTECVLALCGGRFGKARNIAAGWFHNLRRAGGIYKKRQLVERNRKISDAEVRAAQVPGLNAVATFLSDNRPGGIHSWVTRFGRSQVAALTTLVTLLFVGLSTRNLFSEGIASVGGLAEFGSTTELLEGLLSRDRPVGLGQEGFAPTGIGVLTVLSWLFFGQTALLRTVLIVAMMPLGALGMWRVVRPFGSNGVQAVALAVYMANPVPYNALSNGSWGGLLFYGAAPWLLAALTAPKPQLAQPQLALSNQGKSQLLRPVLSFGVILGLLVALVADVAIGVGLLVLGLLLGSVLAGAAKPTGRMLLVALCGTAIAVALNLPWLLNGVPPLLTQSGAGGWGYSWAEFLRFDTGPFGGDRLGWALPVAATLPLVLAQASRLTWAVRGWTLYLGTAAVALIAEHEWLAIPLPRPEVIQVPGAVGLALAVAMGLAAFQVDLPQARFGWRQLVPLSAVAALCVAMLPAVAMVSAGTWNATEDDYSQVYPFNNEAAGDTHSTFATGQRVLWVGHRDLLPLGGWQLEDGLWFAISQSSEFPTVAQRWVGPLDAANMQVREALLTAPFNGTKRLGAVLARFDIGTVLVAERLAPAPFGDLSRRAPEWLITTLDGQLDLVQINITSGTTTYANTTYMDSARGTR